MSIKYRTLNTCEQLSD